MNLAAVEALAERFGNLDVVFVESGGDNLSATFSPELADLTIYVIDVAEGENVITSYSIHYTKLYESACRRVGMARRPSRIWSTTSSRYWPRCAARSRITSYNVCYTKLLRS